VQGGLTVGDNVIRYQVSLLFIRTWLEKGWLSKREFAKIESMLAGKYNLPKNSVFRGGLQQSKKR
jgi:hypothetical protein